MDNVSRFIEILTSGNLEKAELIIEKGKGKLTSKIDFNKTKFGKNYNKFYNDFYLNMKKRFDKIDRETCTEEQRDLLVGFDYMQKFMESSLASMFYNMRMWTTTNQFITDLLVNKCMNDGGQIVAMRFEDQIKLLQEFVDDIQKLNRK